MANMFGGLMGSPSASGSTSGSLGLPRYNANTISDFLRQQLAERAKRRAPSNPLPKPGYPQQMGGQPGVLSTLFGGNANGGY